MSSAASTINLEPVVAPTVAQTVAQQTAQDVAQSARIDLAIIIPTFNERGNVPELIARLEETLHGVAWELVFVDDDSPDDTAELVAEYARRDPRVRLIHRIGRRGLSSACIEGVLATTANFVAIMDADMQHDESILPRMFATLRHSSLDLVVGTRNANGGSMGQFGLARRQLSRLGERVSHMVCQCEISDPMSGFFVFRRSFFTEVVHRLHGGGFKILVDMLAAAERPVQLAEVGYTFRKRRYGESKLDVNTAVEFLLLIVDRLTNCLIPVRLAAFSLVGAAGVFTHMGCLALLMFGWRWQFVPAQIASTYLAMTGNFFLSNLLTSRDRSLRGMGLIGGLMTYCLACSLGAWANVVFAHALLLSGSPWYLAGIAGIILSSVWNHSMSNLFSWNKARFPGKPSARFAQAASELNPWE